MDKYGDIIACTRISVYWDNGRKEKGENICFGCFKKMYKLSK